MRFNDTVNTNVRLMSTKVPINLDVEAQSEEGKKTRQDLQSVLRELEFKQRQLMKTMSLKSQIEDKRLLIQTKGGVPEKVSAAVANLTMFSKECDLDLQTIGLQLEQAQDELKTRAAQTMRQETEIRIKRSQLEN